MNIIYGAFKFSCEKEYLEFRDGAAVFSPLINHLCKYYEMPDIETKENFLYIKYFTDSNVPGNGFKLNITIGILLNSILQNVF